MEIRLLKNNKIIVRLPDGSYYVSKFEIDKFADVKIFILEGAIKIINKKGEEFITLVYQKDLYEEITNIDALECLMDIKEFRENQLEIINNKL